MSTRNSSGTTYAGWGVVLRNVSPDEDALDVDVTLNFLNAAGQTVRFSTEDYEAIPAGSTYYVGGYDTFSSANPPTRIEVAYVQMGTYATKSIGGFAPV